MDVFMFSTDDRDPFPDIKMEHLAEGSTVCDNSTDLFNCKKTRDTI
jgi:hypothetical protein